METMFIGVALGLTIGLLVLLFILSQSAGPGPWK